MTHVVPETGQGIERWLAEAYIDPAVAELRPDYAALLIVVEGLRPGPTDAESDALLAAAEEKARALLGGRAPHELEHLAQWREAFRAFGAKPQRTRPSAEALLRRIDAGLPRIDRITDAYNAVSVGHALPIGGEDLDAYQGPARLVRATGDEPFDVMAGGEPTVEHPAPGEVVWRDDAGVTCRRWNWRQCVRTRLTETTKNALFLLERLEPYPLDRLAEAGDRLAGRLRAVAPDVRIATRLIGGR